MYTNALQSNYKGEKTHSHPHNKQANPTHTQISLKCTPLELQTQLVVYYNKTCAVSLELEGGKEGKGGGRAGERMR